MLSFFSVRHPNDCNKDASSWRWSQTAVQSIICLVYGNCKFIQMQNSLWKFHWEPLQSDLNELFIKLETLFKNAESLNRPLPFNDQLSKNMSCMIY